MTFNNGFEKITTNRLHELRYVCRQFDENASELHRIEREIEEANLNEGEVSGYTLRRIIFLQDRLSDIRESIDDVIMRDERNGLTAEEQKSLHNAMLQHLCKGRTYENIYQKAEKPMPVSRNTFYKMVDTFYHFLDFRAGQKITIC